MSFRLADGTLNTDYKIGDKFKVVANKDSCAETVVGEIVILNKDMDSENPFFDALDGSGSGWRCVPWYELVKYQDETYTESELSEIEELRDRVEYLESLCEDYSKILSEKDVEFKPISDMTIEDWKQSLDHGWVFETRKGELLKVSEVVELHEYPVKAGGMSFTTEGQWNIGKQDIDDIVKRIK